MKSASYSFNNLILNRSRNCRPASWQVLYFAKNNWNNENNPERRTNSVSSTKQFASNARSFETTKLYIKNMVSIRCKIVVKAVLENLGLNYSKVELGEAEIIGNPSHEMKEKLNSELLNYELELIEDKKTILVEKIKKIMVELIHYSDEPININISDYLSEKLNHGYTYLANLFSEVKGMSLQYYIMAHKIERVKELLMYDELNITEIAWKLHYSSVAHLSNQFKKITGMTPTHYKNLEHKTRISLETI